MPSVEVLAVTLRELVSNAISPRKQQVSDLVLGRLREGGSSEVRTGEQQAKPLIDFAHG